jgi:prepilin-type N-terminal cleavage/methylation domain-containing protein
MKNEKGLTLLEVLISMLVLAIGLICLVPLMILSVETNTISQNALNISNLAKEKLERYENSDALPALPFKQYEEGVEDMYNISTVIIDNVTDSLIPDGLCHIQIDINWTDNTGASRNAVYSTFLRKES